MKVILNSNEELVNNIKAKIKENNGYCPCAIEKTADTKCICKNFRDKCARGYLGECDCGLYKSIPSLLYLCGDINYKDKFIAWYNFFSKQGYLVFFPSLLSPEKLTDEQIVNLENINKQKITFADTIFVIDMYGKIDPNTQKIIEEAKKAGKKIMYASESSNKNL